MKDQTNFLVSAVTANVMYKHLPEGSQLMEQIQKAPSKAHQIVLVGSVEDLSYAAEALRRWMSSGSEHHQATMESVLEELEFLAQGRSPITGA